MSSINEDPFEILAEGKFVRLVKDKEYGWEFTQRVNCSDVVVIFAMTNEKNVLFVEQFRPPVQRCTIEFPAGLINDTTENLPEETITEGAKRELIEETGYSASEMKMLLKGPVSAGSSANALSVCLAKNLTKVGEGGGVEGEGITVHEVPLTQAYDWLMQKQAEGFLIDPKVFAGLYFLEKER